jgi:Family of unknown function (DUF6318)
MAVMLFAPGVRASAIASLFVLLLSVSGCGNANEVVDVGRPATAVSGQGASGPGFKASPSPTPNHKAGDANGPARNVPRPIKAEMTDRNTKEGLEEYVRFWFSLLSYGYETGDLTAWSEHSSHSCAFCNTLRKSIAVSYGNQGWLSGGHISTGSVKAKFKAGNSLQQVVVQVLQEKITRYRVDKTVRGKSPASSTATVVLASYSQGRWSISDMHPLR